MRSSLLVSRVSAVLLAALVSQSSAQAVAGASYLVGGGAPGAASYRLVDDYQPANFFSKFAFYDKYDPTYGHVQYVNESVAETNGYVQVTSRNTALIKPDTTNLWPRGGSGRPSIRITSKNTYLHGLFVLDLTHMPWGCGTWPAYWLLGPNWPYTGEIDIIEGVNTDQNNTLSLHTSPGCTIAGSGQTGDFKTNNCDARANDNAGCGTLLDKSNPNNYGSNFNGNGGGVYITEWTSEYIKHWFFPRGSIPPSIAAGAPDVSQFGLPAVNAQGACDIDSHFQNMSIIINIDFCGAWAGNVYRNYPNCPQNRDPSVRSLDSCVDFVGNNPAQLGEAYFDINSLRVYQMPENLQTASTYSTSLSSVTSGLVSTNTISIGQGAPTTASAYASTLIYTGPLSSSSLASSLAASSAAAISTTHTPSASAVPAASASCPNADGQTVVDNCGMAYILKCNSDTTGGSPGPTKAKSFNECFEACSSGALGPCSSFTYVISTRNCYLKFTGSQEFLGYSTDFVSAIMVQYYGSRTPSPESTSRRCTAQSGSTASSSISIRSSSSSVVPVVSNSVATSSSFITSSPPSALQPSARTTTGNTSQAPSPAPSSAATCYTSFDGLYNFHLVRNDGAQLGTQIYDLKLTSGVLMDDEGRTAYISQSYQLVFANSQPTDSVYASGWCMGSDGFVYLSNESHFCYYPDGSVYFDESTRLSASGVCTIARLKNVGRPSETVTSLVVTASLNPTSVTVSTSNGEWVTSISDANLENGGTSTSTLSVWSGFSDLASASIRPTPSPTSNINPQGFCGGTTGYDCYGAPSGNCCSANGYCGQGPEYCGEGCQDQFGECSLGPSSTSLRVSDGLTSIVSAALTSSTSLFAWSTSLRVSNGNTSTTIAAVAFSSSIAPSSSPVYSSLSGYYSVTSITQTSSSLTTKDGVASTTMFSVSSSGPWMPAGSTSPFISNDITSTTIVQVSSSATTTQSAISSGSGQVAPPCPTGSSSSICATSSEATSCSSAGGMTYSFSCGKIWTGTVIPDSLITSRANQKRVNVGDFATCQSLCDRNSACIGVNYIGTNCTLFSEITGQKPYPGAVTAAQVPDNEPSCPSSAGSLFADNNGVAYDFGCYTSYAGNNIGAPIFEPALSRCLLFCDLLSECVGVEYDVSQNYCYLKSSFAGIQTSNTARVVARRSGMSPTEYLTTTAQPVTVTPGSLTTTLSLSSGATITKVPVTTLVETLPPGGSFTSVSSGSSTGSFYVYTTSTIPNYDSSGSVSLCVTCGIVPTIITNPGDTSPTMHPTRAANIITVTRTTQASTCPSIRSQTRTTTLVTTHTITSCGSQPICLNPGLIISGSSSTSYGAVKVTTTSGTCNQITYTDAAPITTSGQGKPTSSAAPSISSPSTNLPACPEADHSIYTDYMGLQHEIFCDTLFTDTTISTSTAVRLVDCIAFCDMYNIQNMYSETLCLAYSWTSGMKTDNCALKSGVTSVQQTGTHSGKLLTGATTPRNNTGPAGDGSNTTDSIGTMQPIPTGYSPGEGVGNSVATIMRGSTILSTYATASGISTVIGTQTFISREPTIVSTPYATETDQPGGAPEHGEGGGNGEIGTGGSLVGSGGPGTNPSLTAYIPSTVFGVSTAYSVSISNGIAYTSTYGVTTVLTVSYAPASTRTVTTTTVSVSISNVVSTVVSTAWQYSTIISNDVTTVVSYQVSTAYLVSTIDGGTVTQNGPTFTQTGPTITQTGPTLTQAGPTFTQAGPTVTASLGSGVVTITQGTGGGGQGGGGYVTITAPQRTVISYVYGSSSSRSVSFCRTTATNYLENAGVAAPGSYKRSVLERAPQPAARPQV